MDVIGLLKAKYHRIAGNKSFKTFIKFGAPMFIFCVGGSYLLEEFQIIRYDFISDRHNREMMDDFLKLKGINKVDMRAEYERIQNADTSNYKNIRGPRVYEDNHDFLKNREMQEKRLQRILGRDTPESPQQSDVQNAA